ncbi:hypothetical protein KKA23_01935 [Patescibacteria group bacterium]|nr:hypothetical protein [Patescibacteria group bacterium]
MLSQHKKTINTNTFLIICTILIALIFFGIGRLSVPSKEPILIKNLEKASVNQIINPEVGETKDLGKVVTSKNGAKYHLPDCPGAKQISEKNKVWYDSIQEAEKAGYSPAKNCPGLQ